jgi:hypothetical protein
VASGTALAIRARQDMQNLYWGGSRGGS